MFGINKHNVKCLTVILLDDLNDRTFSE